MKSRPAPAQLSALFGDQVQYNVPLANNTSARIGGSADAVLTITSADLLENAVGICWKKNLPFKVIGAGSNILISDRGIRELVILNKAKRVELPALNSLSVYAESGASFARLANQVSSAGYDGLVWAASIPGSVGGAVYGNAGAFGGDTATSLLEVELATPQGHLTLTAEKLGYDYRTSVFKRGELNAVILGARFALKIGDPTVLKAKIEEITARRKNTQPPGASMGSMFKNPPNDFAGRLIEACGLKGTRVGNASISKVHANFFVNEGDTSAQDVVQLIALAKQAVYEKFKITLHLEIELLGEWSENVG